MQLQNCRKGVWNRYTRIATVGCFCFVLLASNGRAEFRVGAAVVDVSPEQFPVLINGGMMSRTAEEVRTAVNARAIVLDNGNERVAMVVVDSCMLPKQLLDEAKQLAASRTKIKPEKMLISATHAHSAPSSMGALGTDADANYVPLLRQKLAEAIAAAESNLAPAVVGWGTADAGEFTALRRWVIRPDKKQTDPFGNLTVRANMHAAKNQDDAVGPTGPEDPTLSMISFARPDGQPIAVLTNFSMHYFGDSPVSADYFGYYCQRLETYMMSQAVDGYDTKPKPVAVMSHGCSGDIWKRDYMQVQDSAGTIQDYALGLEKIAIDIYDHLTYYPVDALAMQEARIPMKYRVPDAQRLSWANEIVATMGDRLPTNTTEVYAREQVLLDKLQSTEVVLQAIRIGDIAIATTPNETYALTGLKLKLQSPFEKTMVIELANGGDGYIPPPEQHFLGGYNTWPARSAGLEITAEPRIVAKDLQLLENVCSVPRRVFHQGRGPEAKLIEESRPSDYWRMSEFSPGPLKNEISGSGAQAVYEPGVIFFLEGDEEVPFTALGERNRCPHFAGGRVAAVLPVSKEVTVAVSFWNGLYAGTRPVAGWFISSDYPDSVTSNGIHLGLAGDTGDERANCLMLQIGENPPVYGHQPIPRWDWHRVTLTVTDQEAQVYLRGHKEPEIRLPIAAAWHMVQGNWYFGGRSDNQDNWEGKLDEI
ncbi:MAG: hypothetical protein KDB03_28370, partial [Planctomycetales bacterium]|nr:hypothetical protein [Planctomycetales bacterium]